MKKNKKPENGTIFRPGWIVEHYQLGKLGLLSYPNMKVDIILLDYNSTSIGGNALIDSVLSNPLNALIFLS